MTTTTEKKTYPVIKMPNPKFNIKVLKDGNETGFFSRTERKELVGEEQVLVNNLNRVCDTLFAFGIVKIASAKRLNGIGEVSKGLVESVDEFTMREFQTEKNFWFHPFELVKAFDPVVKLKKPASGHKPLSEVNLEEQTKEEKEVPDGSVPEALERFMIDDNRIQTIAQDQEVRKSTTGPDYVLAIEGSVRPWISFPLDSGNERIALEQAVGIMGDRQTDIGFVCKRIGDLSTGQPVFEAKMKLAADVRGLSQMDEVLTASSEDLNKVTDSNLKNFYTLLHTFHMRHFAGNNAATINGAGREDVVKAYVFVLQEMEARERLPDPKDELDSEAMDLVPDVFKSKGIVESDNALAKLTKVTITGKVEETPPGEPNTDSQASVYECAVGPILEKDIDGFANLVKINDAWFSQIGKTNATNVKASQGDVLLVQFAELLVKRTGGKKTVQWETPVVVEKVAEKPDSFEVVETQAFSYKAKKFVDKILERRLSVIKGDTEQEEEEQIVYGIVLEPETVDKQQDIYSAQEIRTVAHRFMEEFGHLGLMHRARLDGRLKVLESYIAPQNITINKQIIKKGTWLMVIRVLDKDLWKAVKEEQLTGLSIGGSAIRKPEDNKAA